MPLLDDMAVRLKDKGIEFVAVSIDEEKAAAEAFLGARPRWTLTVVHDPQGKVPELLQPPKMPTSYLIDGKGVLRYVNAGFERADTKKIESRLLALAAEGR
jgi:Thioredoxin-like